MFQHRIRYFALLGSLASACCLCGAPAFANTLQSVAVEPTFECAGIIATLSGSDAPGTVKLEIKKPGEAQFREAHEFVRYDAFHMASSLFDLQPGTTYDIRVTLGSQVLSRSFATRPEFALPQPLRTVPVSNSSQLGAALANAQAGDEIVLAPGIYAGGLTVARSGTADHPVVIRGDITASEKTKPADQRTGLPVINGSGTSPVINVTGSYVVLDSLRIENVSTLGIQIRNAHHDVVAGCQVVGPSSGWNHYIYVEGGTGRHLIQDNYVYDTAQGAGAGYGIYQNLLPGPGTVIRRNIVTGFHDGINPSGNEQDLTDANIPESHPDVLGSWPNQSTDVYENTIRVSYDDDIETDGIAVNMRIFRNYLSAGSGDHCVNAFSIAPVAPGPFFFVRNVIVNFTEGAVKYNTASNRGTIRNCYFYHNTIKNDEGTARRGTLLTLWEGAGDQGSPSKNTYFKNNILMGDTMLVQRLVSVHTPAYNPNIWHSKQSSGTLYQWGKNGPYYASFAAWQAATGEEAQGIYADALVDSSFHILPNSPAIDKGVRIPGINDAYAGSAPDMGAFEFGAPVQPGNPPPTVPEPVHYSMGGTVHDAAASPLAGALVHITGAAARSAVTDMTGAYVFVDLPSGDYTVTISKSGYAFSPAGRTVALGSDVSGMDFSGTAAPETANLDRAFAYPNPWKPGDGAITFTNVTRGTTIRIFTLNGELVREIREPDRTEVQWKAAGDGVASGIYLCVLTNDAGEKKRLKIAVIR